MGAAENHPLDQPLAFRRRQKAPQMEQSRVIVQLQHRPAPARALLLAGSMQSADCERFALGSSIVHLPFRQQSAAWGQRCLDAELHGK